MVRDSSGRTVLHHAVKSGSKDIVKYIIENGELGLACCGQSATLGKGGWQPTKPDPLQGGDAPGHRIPSLQIRYALPLWHGLSLASVCKYWGAPRLLPHPCWDQRVSGKNFPVSHFCFQGS